MNVFEGILHDGETALPRPVQVILEPEGLVVTPVGQAADEGIPPRWAYAMLRLLPSARATAPTRLAMPDKPDLRLAIDDAAFPDVLRVRAPHLLPKRRGRLYGPTRFGLASVGALVLLTSLWAGLPWITEGAMLVVPRSIDRALGKHAAASIENLGPLCTNKRGVNALARLSKRLAAAMPGKIQFHIQVRRSGIINAIALPGGEIVVFSGLIDKLDDAEELAGVLAHELSHVRHRHVTQRLLQEAVLWLVLKGSGSGLSGQLLDIGKLSYNRDMERQADADAVKSLAAAGIDSGGMARFFARLKSLEGPEEAGLLSLLQTHPPTGERQATAQQAASDGEPALSASAWKAVRKICVWKQS